MASSQQQCCTLAQHYTNAIQRARASPPGDYPGGKKGDVLTVEFTVAGIPCLGVNSGPAIKHSEGGDPPVSRSLFFAFFRPLLAAFGADFRSFAHRFEHRSG